MKLKRKVKNWYNKPRSGFIYGLSSWILKDPKALDIVMTMGHIVAAVIFGGLFIASLFFWNLFVRVLLGVLFAITLRTLHRFFRFKKGTGSIFQDMNMNDLLYNKETKAEEVTKDARYK